MKDTPNLRSDTIRLPELAWRKVHALGEIQHVVRPTCERRVATRETFKVSERKSEPLVVLEGGERLVLTKRKHCPVPNDVDGVLDEAELALITMVAEKLHFTREELQVILDQRRDRA